MAGAFRDEGVGRLARGGEARRRVGAGHRHRHRRRGIEQDDDVAARTSRCSSKRLCGPATPSASPASSRSRARPNHGAARCRRPRGSPASHFGKGCHATALPARRAPSRWSARTASWMREREAAHDGSAGARAASSSSRSSSITADAIPALGPANFPSSARAEQRSRRAAHLPRRRATSLSSSVVRSGESARGGTRARRAARARVRSTRCGAPRFLLECSRRGDRVRRARCARRAAPGRPARSRARRRAAPVPAGRERERRRQRDVTASAAARRPAAARRSAPLVEAAPSAHDGATSTSSVPVSSSCPPRPGSHRTRRHGWRRGRRRGFRPRRRSRGAAIAAGARSIVGEERFDAREGALTSGGTGRSGRVHPPRSAAPRLHDDAEPRRRTGWARSSESSIFVGAGAASCAVASSSAATRALFIGPAPFAPPAPLEQRRAALPRDEKFEQVGARGQRPCAPRGAVGRDPCEQRRVDARGSPRSTVRNVASGRLGIGEADQPGARRVAPHGPRSSVTTRS